MPAVSTEKERQHAERKPNCKTDEIEISPRHGDFLPSLTLEISPRSGCNASSNRSASPGVSKIAPSNRKQLRVSFCRAALIDTSLTALSLAKRSAPCRSQRSSLPSVVRKSDTNSV